MRNHEAIRRSQIERQVEEAKKTIKNLGKQAVKVKAVTK